MRILPPPQPAPRDPTNGSDRRRRRWIAGLVLALISFCVSLGLSEVALRLFFSRQLRIVVDERYLLYRYDSQLGWFPIENSGKHVRASRAFAVAHNHNGFRDVEPEFNGKPGIVFLGDSFVWGYDVDAPERFTDRLQARHPEWNIFNFGVSGYGTDQEYLLLQKHFDTYRPRVVFLIFCFETDDLDNSSNMRYGGYYKPYYTITNNHLQLKGIPVPRSERAFFIGHPTLARLYLARLVVRSWCRITNPPRLEIPNPTGAILHDLQKFVALKGAVLLVGMTRPYPRLQEFLDSFKIPWLDLSTDLRFPENGRHWTLEGHEVVAQKIDQMLSGPAGQCLRQDAPTPGAGKGHN